MRVFNNVPGTGLLAEQAAGQACKVQAEQQPRKQSKLGQRGWQRATAGAFRFGSCCVQSGKISLRAAHRLWPLGEYNVSVTARTEARPKWAKEGEEWH